MERRKLLINLLWSSFFVAVIIYNFLYFYLRTSLTKLAGVGGAIIDNIFLFIGIFCFLVVINFDLFMLSRARTITVSPSLVPEGIADKSEEEIIKTAKARWFLPRFIIACALIETIGLFALVVGLLKGNPLYVYILFGLSYLGLIYLRLRYSLRWQRMYLE